MSENPIARDFFETYTRALLDRDARAIAEHYAVPALIEFPDHPVAVSDAAQTEAFFAGAFGQYENVTDCPGRRPCGRGDRAQPVGRCELVLRRRPRRAEHVPARPHRPDLEDRGPDTPVTR
ncbi:hypothetical protein [Polymorphospora sp. NPDC050346]|uniref:hypothetical protein n=1 Tax=Polymorphospora sp. NPDC050346 TaxID=3155780 RepID=UPI0033FFA1EA